MADIIRCFTLFVAPRDLSKSIRRYSVSKNNTQHNKHFRPGTGHKVVGDFVGMQSQLMTESSLGNHLYCHHFSLSCEHYWPVFIFWDIGLDFRELFMSSEGCLACRMMDERLLKQKKHVTMAYQVMHHSPLACLSVCTRYNGDIPVSYRHAVRCVCLSSHLKLPHCYHSYRVVTVDVYSIDLLGKQYEKAEPSVMCCKAYTSRRNSLLAYFEGPARFDERNAKVDKHWTFDQIDF